MHLEFAPRSQLAEWLRSGWSPVGDHAYNPHDYAFVLMAEPVERTPQKARAMAGRMTTAPVVPGRPRLKHGGAQIFNCATCGVLVRIRPSREGKYCSKQCFGIARRGART